MYHEYLFKPYEDDEKLIYNKKRRIHDYVSNSLNKTQGMFDWKNLPDTIPQRNLELMLQSFGVLIFTKVEDEYYVFNGGLGGEPNVYYEPTIFTVANPALNYRANLKIDKDGILIRNDSMQMGLLPIAFKYANMLVENDISLVIKSINYRLENLISASDDRTASSAKQFLDDIVLGKLGVISEDAFFDGVKNVANGRSGNNIKDLIEYEQYLRATWLNELGLDANFNMKRERIQSEEVGQNQDALLTLPENMLESRRIACDKINDMYGLDIHVDFASAWLKEEIEQSIQGVDFDSDEDAEINEEDKSSFIHAETETEIQTGADRESKENVNDGGNVEESVDNLEKLQSVEEETEKRLPSVQTEDEEGTSEDDGNVEQLIIDVDKIVIKSEVMELENTETKSDDSELEN